MTVVGEEVALGCKILAKSADVLVVSAKNVVHPVHVVPLCAGTGMSCSVQSIIPLPEGFSPTCFALNGVHGPTERYLLNNYFVK